VGWWLLLLRALLPGHARARPKIESGLSIGLAPGHRHVAAAGCGCLASRVCALPAKFQYTQVNQGMSLGDFKVIFYYEYAHRLLARLLGLVFALPLLWFWLRRRIPLRLRWPLLGILLLGAAQGYMGWFMVKSGLVDIPRVSHFRVAAHLSLALAIYASMWWLALRLLWPPAARPGRGLRLGAHYGYMLTLVLHRLRRLCRRIARRASVQHLSDDGRALDCAGDAQL
jgi:heme A synthase